jgi:Eco57I restriction-modification methylase
LQGAGFDAVIGNPPYVNVVELAEELRDWLLDYYQFSKGRVDIYLPFFERSLHILAAGGHTSFITPNKWFVYAYGQPTREALLTGPFFWVSAVDLSLAPGIFEDADTYSQISVFKKPKAGAQRPPIQIVRFLQDESERILNLSEACRIGVADGLSMAAEVFANLPQTIFSPRLNKVAQSILRKAMDVSDQVGEIFDVEQLIRIGSAEERKKLIVNESVAHRESTARKVVDADELEDWSIAWEGRYLLYKPGKLYNPKSPEIFEQPKIFIKDTSTYLQVVPDFGDESRDPRFRWFYALNTIYGLVSRKQVDREMIGFVACCLNCPLSDYLYKILFGALTIGGGFIRFREFIQYLPIPRVELVTSKEDRQKASQQIISQYRLAMDTLKLSKTNGITPHHFQELFSTIDFLGNRLFTRLDVLHIVLAYLAEEMIELNKRKHVEVKRFLRRLEGELNIQPSNRSEAGIEVLTGKSLLKSYAGDYKKGEKNVPFEELWKILLRNANRVLRRLDGTCERKLRQEYKNSLAVLLPIKQKLTATDWLINRLVYRIYGLTEEEISIVERK